MMRWYMLLLLLVWLAVFRSLALQQFEAKYLRDVLLIPTFIVLGMTFDERHLTRTIVVIHAIVLVVLVFEAVDTSAYSELFRIQDYYINTRDYDITDFWNKQSDLYVSATRPDARLFSFIDMHRLSSIFLEPVSLGDYCIIIIAFVSSLAGRLNMWTVIFLAGGAVIALIGCDGRLAAGASILIVGASLFASRLPRSGTLLLLPGVLMVGFLLVHYEGFQRGGDDFAGRVAHTVDLLRQLGPVELLGISNDQELLSQAVDSGIAYLIITQSIFGLAVLWMFITLGFSETEPDQLRFANALSLYLSLTMMVSWSFLTIKTASLLWFIAGSLQTDRMRRQQLPAAAKPVELLSDQLSRS
jgi:putative polymerase